MSYITPDGKMYILRGVPLDPTFKNTVLWASRTSQQSTFINNYIKPTTAWRGVNYSFALTSESYQRAGSNKTRVPIPADLLQDCNYLMFQNSSFGSKWFYAFITEPPLYINNVTAELTYEIDPLQTWLPTHNVGATTYTLDYNINPCFIERQHSTSDAIGSNIEPEPFSTGEYVFQSTGNDTYRKVQTLTTMAYIAAVADTDLFSSSIGISNYDNCISGLVLYEFANSSSGLDLMKAMISYYSDSPDSIISIYAVPAYFVTGASIINTSNLSPALPWYGNACSLIVDGSGWSGTVELNGLASGAGLDGYTPTNKKLYTYPYNFMHIDNSLGSSLIMRYEFMNNRTNPSVRIDSTITQPVSAKLSPVGYKHISAGASDARNSMEYISLSNYPVGSWSQDYYQAYLAQNVFPQAVDLTQSIGGDVLSAAGTGNVAGAAGGIISSINGVVKEHYRASIHADIMRGDVKNGNVNVAHGSQTFNYGRASITHQKAALIDQYFTMYGYAQNSCAKPNINARPHYTYIKTIGANMSGNLPADDLQRIAAAFDNGITFWNNSAEIGNYTVNNAPT